MKNAPPGRRGCLVHSGQVPARGEPMHQREGQRTAVRAKRRPRSAASAFLGGNEKGDSLVSDGVRAIVQGGRAMGRPSFEAVYTETRPSLVRVAYLAIGSHAVA